MKVACLSSCVVRGRSNITSTKKHLDDGEELNTHAVSSVDKALKLKKKSKSKYNHDSNLDAKLKLFSFKNKVSAQNLNQDDNMAVSSS